MDEYKRYLADEVLSQEHLVTYRALSRSLKISANTAKACLYEFHRTQKAKTPNSVHATYLIFGTPANTHPSHQNGDDQDVEMSGTVPGEYPFSDPVLVETVTLAAEDRLEVALRRYEMVHSIHVYSIGPGTLRDLRLLSDTAHESLGNASINDPEQPGSIVNPAMTKKVASTRSVPRQKSPDIQPVTPSSSAPPRAVPANAATFFKHGSQKPKAGESKQTASEPKVKTEATAETPANATTSSAPVKKPVPVSKRGGIMSAFAKAKPKPTPTPLSDDGEDDSGPMPKPQFKKVEEEGKDAAGEELDSTPKKSRSQRHAELRRMMDEDEEDKDEDEDEDDEAGVKSAEDEPMDEGPEEAVRESEPAEEESPEKTVVFDGRRRGKRRVTRKQQVVDDEGFLVTRNEVAWESFSESDEESTSSKLKPSAPAAQPGKSKPAAKKSTKGAQGSITSFFAKKA